MTADGAAFRRHRAWLILVSAVATVVLAGTAVVVLTHPFDGNHPSRRSVPAAGHGNASGPSGNAAFAKIVALEPNQTFHALYQIVDNTKGDASKAGTVELWRKPPRAREDISFQAGGKRVHEASFLTPQNGVACVELPVWTCRQAPAPAGTIFTAVQTEISGKPLLVTNERIAGQDAQCFALAAPTVPAFELCATVAGVPVRVTAAAMRYELVSVSGEVPDSVFTLPAPVASSP